MLLDNRVVLDRANPVLYFAAVTLIFFTFLPLGWSMLILWTLGIGVLMSYLLFRNHPGAPNVLIHLRSTEKGVSMDEDGVQQDHCAVCDDKNCTRHQQSPREELVLPWEGLVVPKVVDDSVTEFIEIIMERYVDSWHNDLTGSKLFPNELRTTIRYALCLFLLRVRKIDIPALVMNRLVQAAASHMHSYVTVRASMQPGNTRENLEEQVLLQLGENLHPAMKGRAAALNYFKSLVRAALPLLLPVGTSESRLLKVFLEELLASKIMSPCMDYVASADFINKFLIRVFDRTTVLVPMIGPQSKGVSLLQRFARQGSRNPLQLDMDQIIRKKQLCMHLYQFQDHLKQQGGLHLLQFYLDCEELWTKITHSHNNGRCYSSSQLHIKELALLYDAYISPSARNKICFHPRSELETAFKELLTSNVSHAAKINKLVEKKLLERASLHVKMVMQEHFCPSFYHSQEFQHSLQPSLTAMSRKTMATADEHSLGKHFERWRHNRKRSLTQPIPGSSIATDSSVEFKTHSQVSYSRHRSSSTSPPSTSPVSDESSAMHNELEESGVFCALLKVQIIDWNQEKSVDVMKKPFIIYTLNTRYERDGVKKYVQVQRRYKEFAVMDARLRQFYGDVPASLPPKKAFHNMDKTFIQSRIKHLETYLNDLLQIPVLNTSRLLMSFLMESSDPQLFMPDSKGGRAGKIIKLVPNILKKEPKGQYLDPFLSSLVDKIAFPQRQPCPESKEQAQRQEELLKQMKEKLQENPYSVQRLGKGCLDTTHQTGEHLQISGVFDLLIYMAMHVYHASRPQMISLLGAKLIAQNSVEALIRSILSTKVNLLCSEARLTELIDLIKHELFFDDSPPRTDKDKEIRRQTALDLIMAAPPDFVVSLIGQERFHCNTTLLIEGLQSQILNKQMLFTMLDMVVMEIFPEFRSKTTPTNA